MFLYCSSCFSYSFGYNRAPNLQSCQHKSLLRLLVCLRGTESAGFGFSLGFLLFSTIGSGLGFVSLRCLWLRLRNSKPGFAPNPVSYLMPQPSYSSVSLIRYLPIPLLSRLDLPMRPEKMTNPCCDAVRLAFPSGGGGPWEPAIVSSDPCDL